jgi:predicted secreted Zn-dependent protease
MPRDRDPGRGDDAAMDPPAAAGLAAALVIGLLAGCGGGPRDIVKDTVKDSAEYYPVAGTTGQDLRWALDRVGPEGHDGHRSDAVTRWHFEYAFGLMESRGRCRLDEVETTTTITMILPRWSAPPEAPRELARRWEEYVTCARLHETGHRRVYLDAITGFHGQVNALGDRESCEAMTGALDTLARETLRKVQEAQVEYEERTDHGYKQCGRFP